MEIFSVGFQYRLFVQGEIGHVNDSLSENSSTNMPSANLVKAIIIWFVSLSKGVVKKLSGWISRGRLGRTRNRASTLAACQSQVPYCDGKFAGIVYALKINQVLVVKLLGCSLQRQE